MPSAPTFWRWLSEDPALVTKYNLALTIRAHIFAEELVSIADDTSGDLVQTEDGPRHDVDHIMRAKLRVDTRRIMSRLLPNRYGDRVRQELTGADGGPVQTPSVVADIQARLDAIREKMVAMALPEKKSD